MRQQLTPEQYAVAARRNERPFEGKYHCEKRARIECGIGNECHSDAKFD